MTVEIRPYVRIPPRAADGFFAMPQEKGAFIVCYIAYTFVRIAAGEIDLEACVGVCRTEILQSILQVLECKACEHLGIRPAIQCLHDPVFEVRSEPLVQPEVAPRSVRHQISGPGMRQFVRDERNQRPVACEDRRRRKGQPRIFHSAKRKRRRQHDDIVTIPTVRSVERFGRFDHLFSVAKLPCRCVNQRVFGVDTRPLPDWTKGYITHRKRQEVGRDRLFHIECIYSVRRARNRIRGAHYGQEVRPRLHARRIGHAHARTVLAGDPRAGEYGLRLREEEGLFLTRRLQWLQPLQSRSRRTCGVFDHNGRRFWRDSDGQLTSQEFYLFAQRPLGCRFFWQKRDLVDVQVARIQVDLRRLWIEAQRQRRRSRNDMLVKIDLNVESKMSNDRLGPGEGMGVADVLRACLRHGCDHKKKARECEAGHSRVHGSHLGEMDVSAPYRC